MNCSFSATWIFGALLFSVTQLMSANVIQFQSEVAATPLLELYTSEGCSSCPPAEAWLSRLKESPKLWKDFVPVAFHVDYWDYLGWKDPFASGTFSERQQDYSSRWRSQSVYTPGFVFDGKEWRGWYNRDGLPRPARTPVGVLTAGSKDGKQWVIRFQPTADIASSSCDFHAALLGFDLKSDVKTGENRGRTLEHDFVVLALANAASIKNGDSFQSELALKSKLTAAPKRLAVAAWVTSSRSLQPLQAIGGWLASTNH